MPRTESSRRTAAVVLTVAVLAAMPVPAAAADGTADDSSASGETGAEADRASGDESDDPAPRRPRRPEKPIEQMSKAEARRAGFVFGGERRASERTAATAVAATGGLFIHGAGHFFGGQSRTGWMLVAMEGVGLALAGSGLLVEFVGPPTSAASAYATTAFTSGVGVFGLSYLADIIGAVQGDELRLPVNDRQVRGGWLAVDYSFLRTGSLPVQHVLRAQSRFDFRPAYVSVRTDQDVELNSSAYEVTAGWRFWRGSRRHTFAYLEATGGMLDFRSTGAFRRWAGEARAGLSVDMGSLAAGLDQLVLGLETGYGRSWYRAPVPDASGYRRLWAAPYLPTRVYAHMNVSEKLHARLEYRRRAGEYLQRTRRFGGIGTLAFRYDSSELLDLRIRGDLGGGYALTAGFAFQVWK
ncbi:MAG: hypothetical protein ABEL76_11990 [Bradymonadaceae bacterium]